VVNSAADPGDGTCNPTECTLREAIEDPTATEIRFATILAGPITLAPPSDGGGALRIERSLRIIGPSGGIVIQRGIRAPAFRIMRIGTGLTVGLENLTLRRGKTEAEGGGILNYGRLTLTNCNVTDNQSTGSHGGGIDTRGRLTLINTRIARNTAAPPYDPTRVPGAGAGIYSHHATVSLDHSTVTRNEGSGITDSAGSLAIRYSEISYNATGGLVSYGSTASTLYHGTVVGNTAYGGISLFQTAMTVTQSKIARNTNTVTDGGGFVVAGSVLTISKSTIANNGSAGAGGGIYSTGSEIRITNSTVSGNSAGEGGGIQSLDDDDAPALLYLVNSTVAFNSAAWIGGGIRTYGSQHAELHLLNSIVARNTPGEFGAPDVFVENSPYSSVTAGYSLIGEGTSSRITNDNGNLVGNVAPYTTPIDPLLGPLAKNGGPTTTHALLAGSPAIDAGTAAGCPGKDQRGVTRPQGTACDMGSFELQ
jgi:CSLREA domain-containing protein